MDWWTWVIFGVALVAFVVLKKLTLASPAKAREWLKGGAKVIDVRSEAEFRERHLPGAINIPLDQLRSQIGRHAPDKEQGLLLHCLSGGRSGVAQGSLRSMGYRNAFNLGSYGRAQRILSA